MLRHILSVGLFVVVAHCVALPSSGKPIPINNQGKHFPVPFVSQQNDGDFYDDNYYPDINDESINTVVRDNGGKGDSRGSQSKPSGKETRPSATQTGGRRQSNPSKGESRPSATPTGGRRPSKSPGGELPPRTTFPSSGWGSSQVPVEESQPSATFPTKSWDSLPLPGRGSRPSDTLPSSARRPCDGFDTSSRQNSRQPGRQQNRNQPSLSNYRNSPAKYIFTSGYVDSSKKPDEERLFRTNKKEYTIATGDPYTNYLVEIIQGPDPNEIGLKQLTTMDGDSRLILENPTGETVIGRVKTYRA
uniref:31 kDa salivary protein n=1 Tax=Phlebotomus duboscqi TaxID=37738 RepID=Q06K36_PHLDU|nr:31 kDa salivary protein [Phlebotomus duboscqi]